MRPVCAYTDFFVVCSGQNARQTKAIVDEVRYGLKHGDERLLPHAVEGERQGDWIVADYLDVVLHVFTPETRAYYGLEDLLGRRAVDRARDRGLSGDLPEMGSASGTRRCCIRRMEWTTSRARPSGSRLPPRRQRVTTERVTSS